MRIGALASAIVLALAMVVGTAQGGRAEDRPNPHRLKAVLDGRPVVIDLERLPRDKRLEYSEWKLVVRTTRGGVLWTSPPGFRDYAAGTYVLEMVGDVDGDGRDELVIQDPVSDVRAETFSVYRWQQGRFSYVHGGTLLQSPNDTEWFPYSKRQAGTGLWIHRLVRARHGVVVAEVKRVVPPPQSWRTRLAEFRGDGNGYRLLRWVDPPE